MEHKVFVYGTLKQGHGNHRWLQGSELLGEAFTHRGYTMLDLGAFPGVLLEGEGRIKGEVYSVTDEVLQNSLDVLEGYPDFYKRKQVDVMTDFSNTVQTVWMYYLDKDGYEGCPVVEEGYW